MLGFFVVALDAQIVNVALPDIGEALGGGLSGLQWVVTGYTLTFSSLLLFAGTLSDRIGARRAYALGMGFFVLASAVWARTVPGGAGRGPRHAGRRGCFHHTYLVGADP
jgi:MFS transporter, DHA2 family, methylenomycin A resistance protein